MIKFFKHYGKIYNWNNGKITGKDNRHLRLILSDIVKKHKLSFENDIPHKLREYLRKIPPFRMRLIANKLTVGSLLKFYDNLSEPKKTRIERTIREGTEVSLNSLISDILKLKK
jgi:hypothetical protein